MNVFSEEALRMGWELQSGRLQRWERSGDQARYEDSPAAHWLHPHRALPLLGRSLSSTSFFFQAIGTTRVGPRSLRSDTS